MALVGLDGMFLDVNECFCEMLGRSEDELVTLTFRDVTYPDDINPNLDLLGKLRRREVSGYRMEKRYVRSNGTIFWGDLTVAAHRDENGEPIKLISVVVDITQKKEDEERFKFVMDELAHRTKNMAAVIQSIVNQTSANATTIDEFRAEVAHRLTGILASHDSITRMEGRGAVLRDLAEQQMAVFLAPNDPRVIIHGSDLTLNPDATRAIGMALHELATNALKYGSLSVPPGTVLIKWETTAAGQFHMLWRERGGPVVCPPERIGFGRRVIERMAAISTNGKVDLKFDPEGIEWRLEAQTASVVEG
jgi:PAS domain S-box-containing protein